MASSTEKELEEQLREAGNKLVDPPSSVDELLPLLDVSVLFFSFSVNRFSFLFLVLNPFGLVLFVIVDGVVLFVLCVKPRFRWFRESIFSSWFVSFSVILYALALGWFMAT